MNLHPFFFFFLISLRSVEVGSAKFSPFFPEASEKNQPPRHCRRVKSQLSALIDTIQRAPEKNLFLASFVLTVEGRRGEGRAEVNLKDLRAGAKGKREKRGQIIIIKKKNLFTCVTIRRVFVRRHTRGILRLHKRGSASEGQSERRAAGDKRETAAPLCGNHSMRWLIDKEGVRKPPARTHTYTYTHAHAAALM